MRKRKTNNRQLSAIKLVDVTKVYTLHHEKPTFIEKFFFRHTHEQFVALDNINLQIDKGEKVGIIGSNGAGKTTLLKIISGITTPNKGKVYTRGKVVSLINLEAGFHPDLSGKENIYLNGLLIGMERRKIETMLEKIISFSELGSFIDSPLFTYSDGMKLRLAFSVAIQADPDILILDESINAGDFSFQKKIKSQLNRFFKEDKTVLVVTHNLTFLENTCEKIFWLREGKVWKTGDTSLLGEYDPTHLLKGK